jgi:hypothetical protein
MKFTAISILALAAALGSGSPTSRTYPDCTPYFFAREDLIKSCVDELNAHGDDIMTIEGIPSQPYHTTAMELACSRTCDDPMSGCAESVVYIQLYTVGTFNTTKRDVACGVQTVLDSCTWPADGSDPSITWNLTTGIGLACGQQDIEVSISGIHNGGASVN